MSVFTGLLNESSKEYGSQKVSALDIDEISTNPLNHAPIINIEELAASIKENGLQNPLQVYKKSNHNYVLINGERRYQALKRIHAKEAAVLIMPRPASEIDERLLIMDANAQRDETPSYKKQRAKEYKEIFCLLKTNNQIATGKLMIDWVGQHMGLSGRQVQRYLQEDTPKIKKEDTIFVTDLQNHIQSKLQTTVKINKHALEIKFADTSDLNRILEIMQLGNVVNE